MLKNNGISGSYIVKTCALTFVLCLMLAGTTIAVPPHPDAMEQIKASKQATDAYERDLERMRELGINTPGDGLKDLLERRRASGASLAATPYRVLVLMVDFSDNTSQVSGTFFDTLMFDQTGNSVRHYYDEVSYTQIDLLTVDLPSTTGWYRAPQTYAYYVDGQRGLFGTYPNNAQGLVEDLVDAANADVNFADYDNDSDGYVDALVIVHSGPGYERTLDPDDIHSHKWGIIPRSLDGVYISTYCMQPEYMTTPGDQTIGVYCHELGHVFGLPDLYDTDYTSRGVGNWCLMSGGSWNGSSGDSPAHPSAWCRNELGWADLINVTANTTGQAIDAVENGGSIYRLWNSGDSNSSEYFLVENRQQTGYDSGLPASGLLIWHVDADKEGAYDNTQEWWPGQSGVNHYLAALEQADGDFDLEHNVNSGDTGDPFPGSTSNTAFSASSDPTSDSYEAGVTVVAVNNISASGMTMTADLVVGLSAGVGDPPPGQLPNSAELAQNYPNPFNPTTTIGFSVSAPSHVVIDIYNVAGQRVQTVFDARVDAGSHEIAWDATNDNGQPVASGIYLYRLTTDARESVKKMVLVR